MAATPPAKGAFLELTGLQGQILKMRPALFLSVCAGPPTRIETIDGTATLVKESPEAIQEMIAKGGRKTLPGAASYALLKQAIDDDDLQCFINGDDGKAIWIEALREISYGRPRSKLSRLLGIYGELLSPFSFATAFSSNFDKGRPSPLEAEMLAKGFWRSSRREG